MGIRVEYKPDFGLVGQMALDTGYGIASQRAADQMMQMRNAQAQRQHQWDMMMEQQKIAQEKANKAYDRQVDFYNMQQEGREKFLGMQDELMLNRQKEAEKARLKQISKQSLETNYKNVIKGINDGTVQLSPETENEINKYKEIDKNLRKAMETAQEAGRAQIQAEIVANDEKIKRAYVNGSKSIPKHARDFWTPEETMQEVKKWEGLGYIVEIGENGKVKAKKPDAMKAQQNEWKEVDRKRKEYENETKFPLQLAGATYELNDRMLQKELEGIEKAYRKAADEYVKYGEDDLKSAMDKLKAERDEKQAEIKKLNDEYIAKQKQIREEAKMKVYGEQQQELPMPQQRPPDDGFGGMPLPPDAQPPQGRKPQPKMDTPQSIIDKYRR